MVRTDLEPVPYRVVDDVITTLQAISAGDDYYATFNRVEALAGDPFETNSYPTVWVDFLGLSVNVQEESLNDAVTVTQVLQLLVVLSGRTDVAKEVHRVAADIIHGLTVDVTRSNLARNTRPTSYTPDLLQSDADQIATVSMIVEVDLATEHDDMTTAV